MFNNFKIVHGTLTTSVQVENNSIKDRGFQICQSSKESEIEIQIGFNKIIQYWNNSFPWDIVGHYYAHSRSIEQDVVHNCNQWLT